MTPDELANEIERLDREATAAPWEQLSGKYMSIDNGQRPQQFVALTDNDEALMFALRNAAPLIVAALRLATLTDSLESDGNAGIEAAQTCMFALGTFRAARAASESR